MGLADTTRVNAARLQQAQNFSDPLAMAIIKGDVKEVQRLLEQGSNPHLLLDTGAAHNYTLLMMNAARTPVTEEIRLQIGRALLDYGIDINAESSAGETALILATKYGHSPLSQALLDAGANPKSKLPETGYTPLMFASGTFAEGANEKGDGNIELVMQLIQKGASASCKSRQGSTALHFAAYKGHAEVAELLIDKGADVNGKTGASVTPLILSAKNGDLPLLKLLVRKGARLNEQDINGQSALMVAAWNFHEEAVRYLLDKGADADLKSNDGRTALTGTLLRSNMLDKSWPAQQRIIQMLEEHTKGR
jgi:ankyrin repeat protein